MKEIILGILFMTIVGPIVLISVFLTAAILLTLLVIAFGKIVAYREKYHMSQIRKMVK